MDAAAVWIRAREAPLESSHASRRAARATVHEDAALAAAARRGDRAAFGRLYDRHAGWVHGLLLARVSAREAADLSQEVFLVALRKIADLGEPERFAGWLGSIARNLASDALRRGDRREVALADDLPAQPGEHADPADLQASAELMALLRRLPDTYREALILRLVEGLSGPEIAERLGRSHGAVRVHLHRGMGLLREALARGGWS